MTSINQPTVTTTTTATTTVTATATATTTATTSKNTTALDCPATNQDKTTMNVALKVSVELAVVLRYRSMCEQYHADRHYSAAGPLLPPNTTITPTPTTTTTAIINHGSTTPHHPHTPGGGGGLKSALSHRSPHGQSHSKHHSQQQQLQQQQLQQQQQQVWVALTNRRLDRVSQLARCYHDATTDEWASSLHQSRLRRYQTRATSVRACMHNHTQQFQLFAQTLLQQRRDTMHLFDLLHGDITTGIFPTLTHPAPQLLTPPPTPSSYHHTVNITSLPLPLPLPLPP